MTRALSCDWTIVYVAVLVPAVKVTVAVRLSLVSFLRTEALTVASPASPLAGERVTQDSEALAVQATVELMAMEITPPSAGRTCSSDLTVTASSTFVSFWQETAQAATSTDKIKRILFIVLEIKS